MQPHTQTSTFEFAAPDTAFPQQSSANLTHIMEGYSQSDNSLVFPTDINESCVEPRVGMPDLGEAQQASEYSQIRRSNASLEHWLTCESPVARAASFDPAEQFQNRYRLPSLSNSTPLPETFDGANDVKYDVESFGGMAMLDGSFEQPPYHLHMSDIDNEPPNQTQAQAWVSEEDRYLISPPGIPYFFGRDYTNSRCVAPPPSPYSTPSLFNDSPVLSPCFSSPELGPMKSDFYPMAYTAPVPRSTPHDDRDLDDDEEVSGGKPYAQLIQECLLQSPGHRMMLRDIYDWFERNTTKPGESGGNGWQNSIRHNLSMNKAFENDKTTVTNARGEPKKATSVWYLTEHALRNGVQSTTRYRKAGGSRRSAYNREMDSKRQCSGSRGGKAARKAAQMRRLEAAAWSSQVPPSDDLEPFDHLVHAANALGEYPGTRGSTPLSPSDHYPCTPKSSASNPDLPMRAMGDVPCYGPDLSYNDVQLHDALCQAGYGVNTEVPW